MATLEILQYPNGTLGNKSAPVENIDENLRSLADSMIETMYAVSGIGLAAPQVGVLKELLVVDLGVQIENGEAIVLMNPRISAVNNAEVFAEEGCLSIPGLYAKIVRQKAIEVKGVDVDGKDVVLELEDLLARAIQHEIDHLNGVLFWDHLGKIKRDLLKRKFKKLQKQKEIEPGLRNQSLKGSMDQENKMF